MGLRGALPWETIHKKFFVTQQRCLVHGILIILGLVPFLCAVLHTKISLQCAMHGFYILTFTVLWNAGK